MGGVDVWPQISSSFEFSQRTPIPIRLLDLWPDNILSMYNLASICVLGNMMVFSDTKYFVIEERPLCSSS